MEATTVEERLKNAMSLRVVPLEDYFAARSHSLTAYGDTPQEAVDRLKQMFAVWVDTKFKRLNDTD